MGKRTRPNPETVQEPQPGPLGHNAGTLTTEEQEAILHKHLDAIAAAQTNRERAGETVKALRKIETRARSAAKGDGIPLTLVDEILGDEAKGDRRDTAAYEKQRYHARVARGLPVGDPVQWDLFEKTPLHVRDELDAEGAGYTAGLRGMAREIPDGLDPSLVQPWQKGWNEGDDKRKWSLAKAGEVVDRQINPDVRHGPVTLDPEPEGDEETEEEKASVH